MKHKNLLLVAALSLGVLGGMATFAQEEEPILIGIAVAQTSNVALLGQEQVIGAEIAEEYFNELGGVNGRPIELIFQDTAGDEAGAINAFQTLISQDVVGIVGPTLSQQAFSSDPEAEKAGVPVLAPSNTARGIPQIGKYISRVSLPAAVFAPNTVFTVIDQFPEIEKVAVLFAQNDAFASSETVSFQDAVKEALGEEAITSVQTFQTTDTDFSTQVANVIAEGPQLVIISGLAADGGNLVKQLREFGYTGQIIGGNGLNTANIFPVCQALCDGIFIGQAYSYATANELNDTFRELYKARQVDVAEEERREPPQFSAQAFTAVQVFVEALVALDDEVGLDSFEDVASLRTALNDKLLVLEYETVLSDEPIAFSADDPATPEDDAGEIIQSQAFVAQVEMSEDGKNGRYVFQASEGE